MQTNPKCSAAVEFSLRPEAKRRAEHSAPTACRQGAVEQLIRALDSIEPRDRDRELLRPFRPKARRVFPSRNHASMIVAHESAQQYE